MMLSKVTITGADDGVEKNLMYQMSNQFYFVEWAFLVDRDKAGKNQRYPSWSWIEDFQKWQPRFVHTAAHLCGRDAEAFLNWDADLLDKLYFFDRIQLNIAMNGSPENAKQVADAIWMYHHHFQDEQSPGDIGPYQTRPVIIQHNEVNASLVKKLIDGNYRVNVLFDSSRGKGVTPKSWPEPIKDILCGYAGGINEENITGVLNAIHKKTRRYEQVWVDMETGVRTADYFDLFKVQQVLQKCHEWTRRNK